MEHSSSLLGFVVFSILVICLFCQGKKLSPLFSTFNLAFSSFFHLCSPHHCLNCWCCCCHNLLSPVEDSEKTMHVYLEEHICRRQGGRNSYPLQRVFCMSTVPTLHCSRFVDNRANRTNFREIIHMLSCLGTCHGV